MDCKPVPSPSPCSKPEDTVGGLAPALCAGVSPLPCLFEITRNFVEKLPAPGIAQVAKKAETLYANLNGLIRRVGLERVGFVTLTTPDNCGDRAEANRRLDAFQRGLLRPNDIESISVPERQRRGAFHFHLACAFPWDLRTGFDFAACRDAAALKREYQLTGVWEPGKPAEFQRLERQYFQSANERLRGWWRDVRDFNQSRRAAGFGRCETLPILSNAAALARYVGAYVTTAVAARLAGDKGLRTVRYALAERVARNWQESALKKWWGETPSSPN